MKTKKISFKCTGVENILKDKGVSILSSGSSLETVRNIQIPSRQENKTKKILGKRGCEVVSTIDEKIDKKEIEIEPIRMPLTHAIPKDYEDY